ncbi:hypothetical protein ACFRAQ_36075 [Nocardia sp. NPDC056611]|uniref:hypothetical protein n=1 Tax=Nocardia sp. NPDC056611 TaxID=3345877 RepID=UPI00366E2B2A
MSHFTLTVAIPAGVNDVQAALDKALAPFDENLEVEQYEEDGETYWRNPKAEWDWWVIGGRWRGKFVIREGAQVVDLIDGESSWTNEKKPIDPTKCDGGRIRALDIAGARAAAGEKGGRDWDGYAMAIFGTPQHQPWREFRERVEKAEANAPKSWSDLYDEAVDQAYEAAGLTKEEADALAYGSPQYKNFDAVRRAETDKAREIYWASLEYNINTARADYRAQPRIATLRTSEQYKNWFDGPEDRFDHLTRDEYVQQCRDEAIPGFALLTADGRWLSKGQMGWFGMDNATANSTQTYLAAANEYVDSLTEDTWLINVDCHI